MSTEETFFPSHHKPGLFRSNAWLSAWKTHWSNHPAITFISHNGFQTGCEDSAGFCLTREFKKSLFPITTAFPTGISTRSARSIRSEYFCVAASEEQIAAKIEKLVDQAFFIAWDQLFIPDILVLSPEYKELIKAAERYNLLVVHDNRENTYAVDLRKKDFHQYLLTRGKNTRLKLYNRRKNLAQLGEVTLKNIWPDKNTFFNLLNGFHQKRWAKPCYVGRNQAFMADLLDNLHDAGHSVDLSVLSVANEPVSTILDVTVNHRQYNLQSGYREGFAKNISLGTLHLGYQLQAAFENPSTEIYDFMAGTGKNSNYKEALANCRSEFVSLLLVRNRLLKMAYKIKDAFS